MSNIAITPIGESIGARVEGLDLSAAQTPDVYRQLLEAIGRHKVLVFPGEPLDVEAFHTFARGFGPLQEHVLRKYRHDRFADLSWLSNVAADGSIDSFGNVRATTWHNDGSYTPAPPALGILHAFEVPSRGGATIFADMCNAYDTLDADMQARLADLNGLHCHGTGPAGGMYDNTLDDDQAEKTNDVVHPVVTVHPRNGRNVLYLNETHPRRIRELEAAESLELLQSLMVHATRPENIYAHDWRVGDLLIWDQWSTMHRGAGDFPPDERRVKIRAIVETLN